MVSKRFLTPDHEIAVTTTIQTTENFSVSAVSNLSTETDLSLATPKQSVANRNAGSTAAVRRPTIRVTDESSIRPENQFDLEEHWKRFGNWSSKPIWVPPKNVSAQMAASMLESNGPFASKDDRWNSVVAKHRDGFTQVRQVNLDNASIRLPKGKLYVSVTERKDFDSISDEIPASVQTRLEEFLDGPGSRYGVKVSYLKPLCIELDDKLYFTSRKDIDAAIQTIRDEVFANYDRRWLLYYGRRAVAATMYAALFLPRELSRVAISRRNKMIDDYHSKLEFQRRRIALRAAKLHGRTRTDGCSYDEMLALTNPLDRRDVAKQYGVENQFSEAKREQLVRLAAGHLPWFTALSMGLTYLASVVSTAMVTGASSVAVCDPAFVAEFPDQPGVLVNIGHFDKIAGVRHIEF